MKELLFAAVVAGLIFQGPTEPPEYPSGQFCSPVGDIVAGKPINDHACKCKRLDHSEQCDGPASHDAVCKQWCHEQHCSCPIVCDVPAEPTPDVPQPQATLGQMHKH